MIKSVRSYFTRLAERWRGKRNFRRALRSVDQSIQRFNDRLIYSRLSRKIIDETPDDVLLQTVFDQISQQIGEMGGNEYDNVLQLSKGQQAVYMIWLMEGEINNGGFNQYYSNSSGEFALHTPEALRTVGAHLFAQLVESANQTYLDQQDVITQYQDGTLEGFSKSYENNPLNKFDQEFYALYTHENVSSQVISYIRHHQGEFIFNENENIV